MPSIDQRLLKLEARTGPREIAVWCDNESEVQATIDAMIASGEIAESDRVVCVHWAERKNVEPLTHERALATLGYIEPAENLPPILMSEREKAVRFKLGGKPKY